MVGLRLPQSLRSLHLSTFSLVPVCHEETEEVSRGKAVHSYPATGKTGPEGDTASESQDSVGAQSGCPCMACSQGHLFRSQDLARFQISKTRTRLHKERTRFLRGHSPWGWQGGHRVVGESGLRKPTKASPLRAAESKWASPFENHMNRTVSSGKSTTHKNPSVLPGLTQHSPFLLSAHRAWMMYLFWEFLLPELALIYKSILTFKQRLLNANSFDFIFKSS